MSNPSLGPADICNMALVKLGAGTISSLSDTSTQGVACAAVYYISRDAMLRSHPWSFARVWATLSQLTTAPLNLTFAPDPDYLTDISFSGAYQLPSDCVRVFRAAPYTAHYRIVGSQLYTDANPQALTSALFAGAQPGVGLPPLTNTNDPNAVGIEYISRNTDTSTYDSMFVDAFATKLAMELAWTLTAAAQVKEDLEKEFQGKLMEAWYADGAENWNDALYNNILTDFRNTSGSPNGGGPW